MLFAYNYCNNIEILSECVLFIAFLSERVGLQQGSGKYLKIRTSGKLFCFYMVFRMSVEFWTATISGKIFYTI